MTPLNLLCLWWQISIFPRNEQLFDYKQPGLTDSAARPRNHGGPLQRLTDQLTEIMGSCPTRYDSETDSGIIIDRILGSMPPFF